MFVYGDVVYAQTWQVLTLKNCMEPFSYASTAYLFASALVSVRLFCKNLGNLQKFFGQMVNPPPPGQKKARTPMTSRPLCECKLVPCSWSLHWDMSIVYLQGKTDLRLNYYVNKLKAQSRHLETQTMQTTDCRLCRLCRLSIIFLLVP